MTEQIQNCIKRGAPPFSTALIHGGPGAPGDLRDLSIALSSVVGNLELLQTKLSIQNLIREVKEQLEPIARLPAILIGHSWGAWLSVLFASEYPDLVSKLILVASAPFSETYVSEMNDIRLSRLSDCDLKSFYDLSNALKNPSILDVNRIMTEIGKLISKADSYEVIPNAKSSAKGDYTMFRGIWAQASRMRQSGKLLEAAAKVECPVVAICGDYDPHPYKGVRDELAGVINDFRFSLLKRCGHYPWRELFAREEFMKILLRELN